jgi:3-hydroxyacyl-CoA dehydrogenase
VGSSARVKVSQVGKVRLLTLSHPPVNAMSHALRVGLMEALEDAERNRFVGAVVITGEGGQFVGGADIREFRQGRKAPFLREVTQRLAEFPKPVAVAVEGAALGGGLEIALAAQHRVAGPQAEFALPEVTLGLLPGAGGTQRITHLLGVDRALDLMLSGRKMKAAEALGCGLIQTLSADPVGEALHWAREATEADPNTQALPQRSASTSPTGPMLGRELEHPPALGPQAGSSSGPEAPGMAAIDAARARLARGPRGLFSPGKIIEAVEAALRLPLNDGLALESELFEACLASPQRAALVHAFFAERRAAKARPKATAAALQHIGVVGGGTMGAGIAVALLDAGLNLTLIERDAASIAAGRERIEGVWQGQLAKGKLSEAALAEQRSRLNTCTDYASLETADLVIEAVFEDPAAKAAVLTQLDAHCRHDAVLATNTSYLDVAQLAQATARPQRVLGLHFFSPAHVMKLLEVVAHPGTSPEALATGWALAKRLRKVGVAVQVKEGSTEGFIGNRLLHSYRRAMEYVLEDGASPHEIDSALRELGLPMGPFQMMDLAGGDIAWATRQRRAATRAPQERYVRIADALCERGWLGQKTGRGWYRYTDEAGQPSRQGLPCPEVQALIEQARREAGITPRPFSAQEIQRRYLAAMVNEAAKALGEGVARCPSDIDLVMMHGYGFPRHVGGPLHWADQVGLAQVLSWLNDWAEEDAWFWQPAPLLQELAASGRRFDSLNPD